MQTALPFIDLPPSPDPEFVLRVVKVPKKPSPASDFCEECKAPIVLEVDGDVARWRHTAVSSDVGPPAGPHEARPGAHEGLRPLNLHTAIDRAFWVFHETNPDVYVELVRLCRDLRARGRTKVGMKMLFEVLRWSRMLRTEDPQSDFKLNNNYTSRFARLIMEFEPDLTGLFETRELRS